MAATEQEREQASESTNVEGNSHVGTSEATREEQMISFTKEQLLKLKSASLSKQWPSKLDKKFQVEGERWCPVLWFHALPPEPEDGQVASQAKSSSDQSKRRHSEDQLVFSPQRGSGDSWGAGASGLYTRRTSLKHVPGRTDAQDVFLSSQVKSSVLAKRRFSMPERERKPNSNVMSSVADAPNRKSNGSPLPLTPNMPSGLSSSSVVAPASDDSFKSDSSGYSTASPPPSDGPAPNSGSAARRSSKGNVSKEADSVARREKARGDLNLALHDDKTSLNGRRSNSHAKRVFSNSPVTTSAPPPSLSTATQDDNFNFDVFMAKMKYQEDEAGNSSTYTPTNTESSSSRFQRFFASRDETSRSSHPEETQKWMASLDQALSSVADKEVREVLKSLTNKETGQAGGPVHNVPAGGAFDEVQTPSARNNHEQVTKVFNRLVNLIYKEDQEPPAKANKADERSHMPPSYHGRRRHSAGPLSAMAAAPRSARESIPENAAAMFHEEVRSPSPGTSQSSKQSDMDNAPSEEVHYTRMEQLAPLGPGLVNARRRQSAPTGNEIPAGFARRMSSNGVASHSTTSDVEDLKCTKARPRVLSGNKQPSELSIKSSVAEPSPVSETAPGPLGNPEAVARPRKGYLGMVGRHLSLDGEAPEPITKSEGRSRPQQLPLDLVSEEAPNPRKQLRRVDTSPNMSPMTMPEAPLAQKRPLTRMSSLPEVFSRVPGRNVPNLPSPVLPPQSPAILQAQLLSAHATAGFLSNGMVPRTAVAARSPVLPDINQQMAAVAAANAMRIQHMTNTMNIAQQAAASAASAAAAVAAMAEQRRRSQRHLPADSPMDSNRVPFNKARTWTPRPDGMSETDVFMQAAAKSGITVRPPCSEAVESQG